MYKFPIRVLIVDDYEPWRRFASTTLLKQPELQIIGEVSDGLEAVQQAEQLRPDLILLDIGLPKLNGIEAARRIREVSPASKILFLSENRSAEIAEEALSTGAGGYVVKSDAAGELLTAVNAVLEGRRFVSASLADHGLSGRRNQNTADHPHSDNTVTFTQPQNHQRAEEALRASEERLRLAQQAARIGIFERDAQTGRITWSEGLEPLYGLSPGTLDGKPLAFFKDLVQPTDAQRAAQLIQQALKTGQPTEGEWRAIWPDGSVHWIVSRWQVLMDDSGEPLRVVGVNLDITDHLRRMVLLQ